MRLHVDTMDMESCLLWSTLACNCPIDLSLNCCASFLEECPQHHGHKGDPGVTPKTYGAISERAQVILVWVRASRRGNASYPRRLGVTRVRPKALDGSWHPDFRMLKNTSIGGVSKKL